MYDRINIKLINKIRAASVVALDDAYMTDVQPCPTNMRKKVLRERPENKYPSVLSVACLLGGIDDFTVG